MSAIDQLIANLTARNATSFDADLGSALEQAIKRRADAEASLNTNKTRVEGDYVVAANDINQNKDKSLTNLRDTKADNGMLRSGVYVKDMADTSNEFQNMLTQAAQRRTDMINQEYANYHNTENQLSEGLTAAGSAATSRQEQAAAAAAQQQQATQAQQQQLDLQRQMAAMQQEAMNQQIAAQQQQAAAMAAAYGAASQPKPSPSGVYGAPGHTTNANGQMNSQVNNLPNDPATAVTFGNMTATQQADFNRMFQPQSLGQMNPQQLAAFNRMFDQAKKTNPFGW